jgi:hypothetical protein
VLFEAPMEKSGLSRGYFSAEDVLLNRVSPFGNVQRCQPQGWFPKRQTLCFVRMSIWQIEGNKDACIGVGTQNRPRSSISNFAPERTRPPNICLRNAAKSGVRTRFRGVFCGTIRPITRSRSRSSTVFPALSKALSLRVSRSWRIFTLGTTRLWHILCHMAKKLSFKEFEANSTSRTYSLNRHNAGRAKHVKLSNRIRAWRSWLLIRIVSIFGALRIWDGGGMRVVIVAFIDAVIVVAVPPLFEKDLKQPADGSRSVARRLGLGSRQPAASESVATGTFSLYWSLSSDSYYQSL